MYNSSKVVNGKEEKDKSSLYETSNCYMKEKSNLENKNQRNLTICSMPTKDTNQYSG